MKKLIVLLIGICVSSGLQAYNFGSDVKPRTGILVATFSPPTKGHASLIQRAAKVAQELYVYVSQSKEKDPLFTMQERVSMLKKITASWDNVFIIDGTQHVAEVIKKYNVSFLVRGLRNERDFAYEEQLAHMYKDLTKLETIFLLAEPEMNYFSSSLVRLTAKFTKNLHKYIPVEILPQVVARLSA